VKNPVAWPFKEYCVIIPKMVKNPFAWLFIRYCEDGERNPVAWLFMGGSVIIFQPLVKITRVSILSFTADSYMRVSRFQFHDALQFDYYSKLEGQRYQLVKRPATMLQGRTPQKPHTNRTDHQAHQNKLDPINLREIREVIRQVYRVGGVSRVNGSWSCWFSVPTVASLQRSKCLTWRSSCSCRLRMSRTLC